MMVASDRANGIATLTRMDKDLLKKEISVGYSEEIDLVAYYEEAAGRLVVDPQYVFRRVAPNMLVKL